MPWTDVCAADAIGAEEVIRFDHDGRTFIVARNHEDQVFCIDGLCSHEDVHLADGLVIENSIECPKHSSLFDLRTGEVETPPACEDLRTYPTRITGGRVEVEV